MCRLLAIRSALPIEISNHLRHLALIAKQSKEFQGHGWGVAYFADGRWNAYREINPIWESDLSAFGTAKVFVAHARSAFQDEGIVIENNMPFLSNGLSFVFNGELRGVKIKEQGRIGAEKIFNFIQRFRGEGMVYAIKKAIDIINKRTAYIRALNFVISDGKSFYTLNQYNEDPVYFGLQKFVSENLAIVSSEIYGNYRWEPIKPRKVEVI